VGAGPVSAPLWVSYALWAAMEVLLLTGLVLSCTGLVLSCTALIAGLRNADRANVDAVVRDRRLHFGVALVTVALALRWGLWWGVAAGVVAAVTLRTATTARVGRLALVLARGGGDAVTRPDN